MFHVALLQKKTVMYTELNQIKEQLFDAPVEVKQAFNSIVEYFDNQETFWVEYKEGSETKWYQFKAKDKKDAEKILNDWKRDYPDWIDYSTAKIVAEKYYIVTVNDELSPYPVKSESECVKIFKTENLKKGLEVLGPKDQLGRRHTFKIIEGPIEGKKSAEEKELKIKKDLIKSEGENFKVVGRTEKFLVEKEVRAKSAQEAINKIKKDYPDLKNEKSFKYESSEDKAAYRKNRQNIMKNL